MSYSRSASALLKWSLLLSAAMGISLSAAEEEVKPPKETVNKKEPPPFDYDLFRRDAQVITLNTQFLFWGVYEGNLDYALTMENAAWGPSSSYAQGNYDSANYSWEPGFRIGFSYFRAPRYWEVRADYTRLTSRGTDSSGKPEAPFTYLTGTFPQITTLPLSGAKSHIHLNYNVADLLVDRYFNPNPHLRLRLMGGMSVAWMNQYWRIDYFDVNRNGTSIRNQWRYIAAGLKTGTMVDWYWGNNVYVTASGIFGVFMGGYWNKTLQTVNFQPTASDNPQTPIRNSKLFDPRAAFTAQFAFGPSWQKNYDNSRVELFFGYEVNIWSNLQEIYHSTAGGPFATKETWVNNSLLALVGLTTRLTIDF